jgi:hypothetical protein
MSEQLYCDRAFNPFFVNISCPLVITMEISFRILFLVHCHASQTTPVVEILTKPLVLQRNFEVFYKQT